MLRHPKGYRPYIPRAELTLGTISALTLVSAASLLIPTILIGTNPITVDSYTGIAYLPSDWVAISRILAILNVVSISWALYVRKNIQALQRSPLVWLGSVAILAIIWLLQAPTVRAWITMLPD